GLRAHSIVTESVVRTVGEHRINRFLVGYLLSERARTCLSANCLLLHLGRRDRADDAVAVACWHHVDWPRAGQHQPLLDRLVAVAVKHDQVVFLHAGLHDAAVGSRRADDAGGTTVRSEDPCSVRLTFGDGPGMVEQRAKRAALDTHIDTKDILAQEVEECPSSVEWTPVTVEEELQAVRDGKVDLLCGSAETLTSRKDVDF